MTLIPNRIWFSLTGACNNACTWCYRKGSEINSFLETKLAFSAAKTFAACGVKHCTLTGGEPTLHPEYLPMVACFSELFASCGIITNGRLLADNIPDGWSDNNKIWVTVSLHGTDAEHYYTNTGSKLGFLETVQAVRNLKAKRVRCSLSIVLGQETLARIPEIIQLAIDLKVDMLCFTLAIPSIDEPNYVSCPFEVSGAIGDITSLCSSSGLRHMFVFSLPWCLLKKNLLEQLLTTGALAFNCPVPGGHVIVVKENGALALCTHTMGIELLNGKEARIILSDPALFLAFWNSTKMQGLRRTVDVYRHHHCTACKYRNYCKGGCSLWWKFYDFSKIITQKGGEMA